MSRRRMIAAAIAVVAVCATSACGGAQGSDSGSSGSSETVRLALTQPPSNAIFAALSVAEELGYFKDEGVKVQYSVTPDPISAVAAGKADIAPAGPDQLLQHKKQASTFPVVAFFQYMTYSNAKIVVLPNSPIKQVSDLAGKTIGVQNLGTNYATFTKAELESLNIPDSSVKWVAIPPGAAQANALKKGTVDAIALGDTNAIDLMNIMGTKLNYVTPLETFADIPGSAWAARDGDLKSSPDKYVGFARAWTRAWAYLEENPSAATNLHVKHNPELIQAGESQSQAAKRLLPEVEARNEIMKPLDAVKDAQYGREYPDMWKPVVDLIGGPEATAVIDNRLIDKIYDGLDLDAARKAAQQATS